jgi:hypothetical protein
LGFSLKKFQWLFWISLFKLIKLHSFNRIAKFSFFASGLNYDECLKVSPSNNARPSRGEFWIKWAFNFVKCLMTKLKAGRPCLDLIESVVAAYCLFVMSQDELSALPLRPGDNRSVCFGWRRFCYKILICLHNNKYKN